MEVALAFADDIAVAGLVGADDIAVAGLVGADVVVSSTVVEADTPSMKVAAAGEESAGICLGWEPPRTKIREVSMAEKARKLAPAAAQGREMGKLAGWARLMMLLVELLEELGFGLDGGCTMVLVRAGEKPIVAALAGWGLVVVGLLAARTLGYRCRWRVPELDSGLEELPAIDQLDARHPQY
jgi:hypothetical protein